MADASFKDVPELFEVDIGEALTARTESLATFRELGPPDICHVVKSNGRAGQRDLGSFHFVSGVDASSSASLAAYINSLTYAIEDNSAWYSKGPIWKVRNGCYCCFNAFSRVDVRVDVKIPGGVHAYVIDLRGERRDATPEMWQETYVSALLRAILYSDDPTYGLDAYRKLDPITTGEGEVRFLQAVEALFVKGWQVGSDPEIQVATVVSNHLTAGVMKYFGASGRYQQAANLFEKLAVKEPEVASLLAKSYVGMNEEVKAVQIMSAAMKHTPHSYTLLHVQSDFLRSKGKASWALKLAREAVNCAPSEFVTWEKLTELYIDAKDYESALLTLNSCPMFTYNGKDTHRPIQTSRVHLPFRRQISDILPEKQKTEDDEADPALLRLPAPGLRGTWARAYSLLTRLVSEIGWDELLKTRSAVFVMEEEYRMQKSQADLRSASGSGYGLGSPADGEGVDVVIHEDGTVVRSPTLGVSGRGGGGGADDDASTRAMHSPHESGESEDQFGVSGSIPIIKVSTESDIERELAAAANGDMDRNGVGKKNGVTSPTLERPVVAAAPADQEASEMPRTGQDAFSFTNKRLCERWLDNLFMVLYEDLRVWTIFRAEVAHFKTQHVAYRKTGMEWEILGDLALRLHHKEEAKEAFQRCLDTVRYSQKPWAKLLEIYADEGDITRTIQTAIRVAAYQYADYTEMTYPTLIAKSFFKLGQIHGHAKIAFTLLSMGLPDPVLKIMEGYLQYGTTFKVEGYDF
ncbi:Chs5p-Arf1p-binding proteins-domain-containing protein [Boletus edulis BED1]|uniref:Chs5p-Arf1p-binding proteins-domain-containing protein n=1 Tax=Boletus edulis BED1 TaxID=1328754 RepID=A0AAD4BI83_BOLED|nr:Chs5p-Arf1p-binding proteins-domain-containing protein [Boletus edulis BED1]